MINAAQTNAPDIACAPVVCRKVGGCWSYAGEDVDSIAPTPPKAPIVAIVVVVVVVVAVSLLNTVIAVVFTNVVRTDSVEAELISFDQNPIKRESKRWPLSGKAAHNMVVMI